MHLTKPKLEVITRALQFVLDSDEWDDSKRDVMAALLWAKEQQSRRADGQRSYVGAGLKKRKAK